MHQASAAVSLLEAPRTPGTTGSGRKRLFRGALNHSCVSRRAPTFSFNFQNPLFSQTFVFWKIEKAYSCAFGTVIIATKRCAIRHAASQTPCEWVALCQVWRHFRTIPMGSRKIREKTPFCFSVPTRSKTLKIGKLRKIPPKGYRIWFSHTIIYNMSRSRLGLAFQL